MPPEMHYHEGDPGAYEAHRMNAQLYLAEIVGVDANDEEAVTKWILDNGKKFADLVDNNPEFVDKLAKRYLTVEEISYLRDEFLSDKVDTDDEEHEEEPYIRAA
jgi:hypothetical protein